MKLAVSFESLALAALLLTACGPGISPGGFDAPAPKTSPSPEPGPSPTPLISGWTFVDGGTLNRSALRDASVPKLAAFSSKLYAAWIEGNGTAGQLRVSVYAGSGSTWTAVEGATSLNRDATKDATRPALAVFAGKLYAAWSETDGTAAQLHVSSYNGNDASPSWSAADGGSLNVGATRDALTPALAVLGFKLYAVWTETNGTTSLVRASSTDGAAWTRVDAGTGINADTSHDAVTPAIALSPANKLYAVFAETNGTVMQLRARVYNGNDATPAWAAADAGALNIDPAQAAGAPALIPHAGTVQVIWHEAATGAIRRIHVSSYDGDDSAPSWSNADGSISINANSGRDASNPYIVPLGFNLLAGWQEDAGGSINRIRVSLFNGVSGFPDWSSADQSRGLNLSLARTASTPAFCALSSTLYAAWTETNGTAVLLHAAAAH